MKLTKTENVKGAIFYRDTNEGKLCLENAMEKKTDSTKEVINENFLITSLVGRIIKTEDKNKLKRTDNKTDKDKLTKFLTDFIKSNNINELPPLPELKEIKKWKDKYGKTKNDFSYNFSSYGKNLTLHEKNTSEENKKLVNLLEEHYLKNKNIDKGLEKWHTELKNRIEYKQKRLIKSIHNNKIALLNKSDSAEKNSKQDWLQSLVLDDMDCTLDNYETLYNYEALYKMLNAIANEKTTDKNGKPQKFQLHGRKIYKVVKEYNQEYYEDHKDDKNFTFYLNEVQAYYRHYFIGTFVQHQKTISPKNNKRLQKLLGHAEAGKKSYPARWVRHHIINKINAMLIQNGKLLCYKEQEEKAGTISHNGFKATSDKLSTIQIKESFKKQMFLAITWAINRLNYFFNYGSNNDGIFTDENSDNDILLALAKEKSLRECCQNLKHLDKNKLLQDCYKNKNRIKCFFLELQNSKYERRVFYEKLCIVFSVKNNVSIPNLLNILDAAKDNIYYLRNNLFHPKEKDLFSDKRITEQKKTLTNKEKAVINKLQQDTDRINDCFKEQLRSSSIAEIYSADLLKEVFSKYKLHFELYTKRYEFIPSFRKMYERGANLSEKNGWLKNKPIFTEEELQNAPAAVKARLKKWQAYRNLLQLIYQYSFLPALPNEQKLLERASNYIIDKNNPNSKCTSNSKHPIDRNDSGSEYTSRAYNTMPPYNGTDFAKYMSDLQREQSLKASEQHDEAGKQDKKNYYVRFVQDIFAEAFNSYLDKYLGKQKYKLQKVFDEDDDTGKSKTNTKEKNNIDATLTKLFDEAQIKMEEPLGLNEGICVFFYPFLKLLERRELSKLQQQIIRYRTSVGNDNTRGAAQQAEHLENLLALLIFTFPDQIEMHKTYDTIMQKHFTKFINGNYADYKGVYVQSDKKTAIKQKSMLALLRSGALPLYEYMFKDIYKINQNDYKVYKEQIGLDTNTEQDPSPIEKLQSELAALHKTLCTKNASTDKNEDKITKYKKILQDITKYNSLRRRVTFDLLYDIHIIHTDILNRLVSFTTDWERDMHFLLRGLLALQEKNNRSLLTINSASEIDSIFTYTGKSTISSKFKKLIKKEMGGILNKLLMINCPDQLKEIIDVRNSIAHLNHMTQPFKNGDPQKSIIDIMSGLTKLLNYDLKRKNAVTRVIKELLQKHHVLLNLTKKGDNYSIKVDKYGEKEIKSEQIIHLKNLKLQKHGKEPVTSDARDDIFLKCIERLLTFSYNNKSANDKH